MKPTYSTGLNCIDGAVQGAVRKHSKQKNSVERVDMITHQGIVKLLADSKQIKKDKKNEKKRKAALQIIEDGIETSVVKHGSRAISIAGHHDCAANPVSRGEQVKQLRKAEATVRGMLKNLKLDNLGIKITLLWINEDWMPEEVSTN
jgi:hypothetical protein